MTKLFLLTFIIFIMNNMSNIQDVEVTKIYRQLQDSKEKTVVSIGGAGSSKSYSQAQFMIFERLLKRRNYQLLVLRKTMHSNKLSAYKTFMSLLQSNNIYQDKNHNKTDLTYNFSSLGNYILFAGMDNRDKIKSTEWHDIWIEEANEFTKEDYTFLKSTRLFRGSLESGFVPRVFLTLNPNACWIKDLEGKEDVKFIWSTYKDNPFCNPEYIAEIEKLKDEDETYYKIYALGQWASAKNIIYRPYIMDLKYPERYDEIIYGIDFGYNSPSALVEIGIKDMEFYETELLYQTKLNGSELVDKLKDLIPSDKKQCCIYGDSEDPSRIQEIADAGFNIYPAEKGKNSVKDGIDFIKRQKLHSLDSNVNLNKEHEGYKYKENRTGTVTDDPVKFRDHLKDAERYAIYSHFKNRGDTSIRWA